MALAGKKILIDPGHGGTESGAVGNYYGNTLYEQNFNLMFAEEAASYLRNANATVIMTRTDDSTVGINERWQLGSENNVDAVISVHFNGGSTTVSGTETYYAETRPQDQSFAQVIQNKVSQYLGTNNRGVFDDIRTAVGSLGILRYPTNKEYPRALVEVEYITNEEAMHGINYPFAEAALDFAYGILRAMEAYFA